ncbi:MAG: gluconate 2-dehydrogenase subunit 3 family protein [Anaerolineae bacterium]|nr:gluconate 2-dehydrogenase subunit 3 family protein [Anaerolineae bacterium]
MTSEAMFTELQLQTLQTMVNGIIPADDYPAGWEAGVGAYLLHQLEGDLQHLLLTYRAGLEALNAEAQAIHANNFSALSPVDQDKLLASIEAGHVHTKWPMNPPMFFRMVVDHAAEGFYSDPGNGGNQDEVAWRMIGFEVRG